jgi:hypothetical protein
MYGHGGCGLQLAGGLIDRGETLIPSTLQAIIQIISQSMWTFLTGSVWLNLPQFGEPIHVNGLE